MSAFWFAISGVGAGVLVAGFAFRSAFLRRMRRFRGATSGLLDILLSELLHKGEDRSALLIQANDSVPSIQVEKYVEAGSAELVWVLPRTDWSVPYVERFVEEVRQAGFEVSARVPRPRRHEMVEVPMGHDLRGARKLILRVLRDVYRVEASECKVTLLNVPNAELPA